MKEAKLAHGVITYEETGSGEPVVFVHPFLTNAVHWRKVVPLVAGHARCITPTFPFGAHEIPMRPEADLSPPGLARIVVDFLDALGI
ncbi:MAG: alpha/beta fold hydrolase, partial [Candidatus Binatia bacterium]